MPASAPTAPALGPLENWQRILAVNLWGVIHGALGFAPTIERARQA
jgi:NAD(P)-dependent dehydrogenase (short-subunit alcohol dehydrogenase family)